MQEPHLDAGPMIRALRDSPGDFERRYNCIRHLASRHWLGFDANGNARILACCSRAELPISSDQSAELRAAVAQWEETYWRPLVAGHAATRRVAEINREFARHFGARSRWRRAVDAVLRRFGIGAAEPRFHIDPSPPEGREFLAAALMQAGVNRDPDRYAQRESTNA
jgi:hypothetical protein